MLTIFSILRFLHIVAGICWAGGAFLMNLIVGPAIGSTGDAGKQFGAYLATKTFFPKFMILSAVTTVLAGSVLYGIDSNWFSSGWMATPTGIGFGIGAAAGVAALVFGFMISKTNSEIVVFGSQIQGKSTDAQLAQIAVLRKRQVFVTNMNTIFMTIAVSLMASARLFG